MHGIGWKFLENEIEVHDKFTGEKKILEIFGMKVIVEQILQKH